MREKRTIIRLCLNYKFYVDFIRSVDDEKSSHFNVWQERNDEIFWVIVRKKKIFFMNYKKLYDNGE